MKIRIPALQKEITARKGDVLSDVLQKSGIPLSAYCGRRGLCGKCEIEILEGNIPELKDSETRFFSRKEDAENHRLACLFTVEDHLTLHIPETSLLSEAKILKTGIRADISPDAPVKKYALSLKTASIQTPTSLVDLLQDELCLEDLKADPEILVRLADIHSISAEKPVFTAVLFDDHLLLDIEPGDTVDDCWGVALDVGTTTVAAELIHLISGLSIRTEASLNGQSKYGADVISRLSYALENPARRKELQKAVLQTTNDLIDILCRKTSIPHKMIYEVVLSGNTVMNHLFLGLPIQSLAASPYNPVFTRIASQQASLSGLNVHPAARLSLAPNIRSFVGGDISAGLAAVSLTQLKGVQLYIDLGTNGEIILKTEEGMTATSTAAGPAFEGANIGCGLLAVPGAVHKAVYKKSLHLETIGGLPPIGVCGTGLIDLLAIFLEQGKISPSGAVVSPDRKISINENMILTQKDVREVQLACAAIKTGMIMLLERKGLSLSQVDGLIIAGAFGNSLNITNAKRIGLLPDLDIKKMVFVGNAALGGAKAMLISHKVRSEVEEMVGKIGYISLAASPQFQDRFIESLAFPDRISS